MRGLIIGLQYENIDNYNDKLKGCYQDTENIKNCLFKIDHKIDLTIMRDDLDRKNKLFPTRVNIIKQFDLLIKSNSKIKFFYFSGHGTSTNTLISNDFTRINGIKKEELNMMLRRLKKDQTLYAFMDCCHSSSGFALSYIHNIVDGEIVSTSINDIYENKKYIKDIDGQVYLFSATNEDKGNNKAYELKTGETSSGYFTNGLCLLLENRGDKMSIRQFFVLLNGLIKHPNQIPTFTSNKKLDIDNIKLSDFEYELNKKNILKNKFVVKGIINKKKNNKRKLLLRK